MRFLSVVSTLGILVATPALAGQLTILAFGDSLTAGYGLAPSQAFPAVLERALRERGFDVAIINAGVSGDTTGGGRSRLAWSLADNPHLVIVELGANDALRGIPPEVVAENLDAIVTTIRERGARVILAGMYAPRNWDHAYQERFNAIYPELARRHNVPLYPFFLEGVYGRPELLLDDGIHPNADGVARIVSGILPLVEEELRHMKAQ